MIASTSPDRVNVFKGLKIFKTNDFAQAGERYWSLDKTRQEHMIGSLVVNLGNVTILAIQRLAIENLRQADETLAASVEPEGVRGYIEIKKATLEFSIFYRGIAH
ncbi:catalase-related domain-containing protein [Methanosarcina sp. T3]|uniref:catalase-related domain-containing protein n=1 Tax=Methanosarcina sp. T3 TaxID=3439062 RepID=UPI003F831165